MMWMMHDNDAFTSRWMCLYMVWVSWIYVCMWWNIINGCIYVDDNVCIATKSLAIATGLLYMRRQPRRNCDGSGSKTKKKILALLFNPPPLLVPKILATTTLESSSISCRLIFIWMENLIHHKRVIPSASLIVLFLRGQAYTKRKVPLLSLSTPPPPWDRLIATP